MRIGRLPLVFSLALALSSGAWNVAHAEGGETAPAGEGHGGEGEHGSEGGVEGFKENFEGQTRNSNTSAAGGHGVTVGAENPAGKALEHTPWRDSKGEIPVLSEDKNGAMHRKNGQFASNAERERFETMEKVEKDDKRLFGPNNGRIPGVTVVSVSGSKEGAIGGSPCGPTGRCDGPGIHGEHGEAKVFADVNRGTIGGSAGVGYQNGGVQAQAGGRATYTLVGVGAEAKVGFGDPNGLTKAYGQGEVQAGVMAEALGQVVGRVDKQGVAVGFQGEAFAGAKAEAAGMATIQICGVAVNLTGVAEAYAGAGAKASGTFAVDWGKATVRIGLQAGLAVGVGAGAGGTIEISLADVLKDPGAAARCVAEGLKKAGEFVVQKGVELAQAAGELADAGIQKLSEGFEAAKSFGSSVVSSVGSFFGGLFGGSKPNPPPARPLPVYVAVGSNVPLRAATTFVAGPSISAGPGQGSGASGVHH